MSLSMHEASIPVFLRAFANLSAILDKGLAHAKEKGMDPESLVEARLAPDMGPLRSQIQWASDTAKGAGARLAGIDIPSFPDDEKTLADLQARIAKTVDFLKSIDAAKLEGSESRTVTLKMRSGPVDFEGRNYLFGFALPNFFFHVATAYDILRHEGVPLSKMDYLGGR